MRSIESYHFPKYKSDEWLSMGEWYQDEFLKRFTEHEYDRRLFVHYKDTDRTAGVILVFAVWIITLIPLSIISIWIPLDYLGWMLSAVPPAWCAAFIFAWRNKEYARLVEIEQTLTVDYDFHPFDLTSFDYSMGYDLHNLMDRVANMAGGVMDGQYRKPSTFESVDQFQKKLTAHIKTQTPEAIRGLLGSKFGK